MLKKQIPNILTLGNLVCGMIGLLSLLLWQDGNVYLWIIFGAFFDFLDGMVARLLKVSSSIGEQLDSLSDSLTFGVLPSLILYKKMTDLDSSNLSFIALLFGAAAVYRLAKFNVDDSQTYYFKGIPTPAASIYVIGLCLGVSLFGELESLCFWIVNTVALSFFMISDIPFIALKFKSYSLKQNWTKYALVFIAISLFSIFQFKAILWIMWAYIIMSLVFEKKIKTLK